MFALALLLGVAAMVWLIVEQAAQTDDYIGYDDLNEYRPAPYDWQEPVDESPWEDWDWPVPDDNDSWDFPERGAA